MTFLEVAKRCLHDEPNKRPTMAQIVVQLESALEQQESSKPSSPGINSVGPCNGQTLHSISGEIEEKYSEVEQNIPPSLTERRKMVQNAEPSNRGSQVHKRNKNAYKLPWFWPGNALWKMANITKKNHLSSLAVFSLLIKNPEDLAFLKKEDGLNGLNVIGEGGCGKLYKATLPGTNGKEIAIKKILQPSRDGEDLFEEDSKLLNKKMRQIRSEIQTVGQIRHRNLLPLLAHLPRPDCHYLVYEYMKNGSLQDVLQGVSEGRLELDWLARYKVAIGVVSGLEYLHLNHTPRIIHRDLKPANILLDDEMEARITDFGLAKAVPEAYTHVTTSNVAGTVGYIAPEYYQTFKFTEKCDIYSFGVVLGVLAMGKFPSDEFFQHTEEMNFVRWKRNVMTSEDPKRAIDVRLLGNGYEEQILLVLKIACFCTLDNPKERPDSKEVRCMLTQIKH